MFLGGNGDDYAVGHDFGIPAVFVSMAAPMPTVGRKRHVLGGDGADTLLGGDGMIFSAERTAQPAG